MSNFILTVGILLAQAEAAPEAPPQKLTLFQQIIGHPFAMFAVLGFVFYLMILKPQQRKRDQTRSMMESMKVNDRVVTIGGIQGTIVAISNEEVTIRVDESTNTKLKMSRPYIQRVVSDEKPDSASS